ncbi:AAA family ATPase [Sphingomonas cynarae]|uniref:AAA family ATPase n=1 Tax=Sphingomonas cynarae TaxID=930197 RepID=UPI003CD0B3F9
MKLTKIIVENFKGIVVAELPLRDTTVLVGTNNSDKSSALQAIHFAARAMYKHLRQISRQLYLLPI